MKKLIILAALIFAVFVPLFSASAEPFRTVTMVEPGKCIFSTSVMPNNRFSDPAYRRVTSVFEAGEKIAARCFYGLKNQEAYYSLGRVANTLRDSGKYYYELEWIRPEGVGGSFRELSIKTYNQNYNPDWNQQRFNMTPGFGECSVDFKGDAARKYGADSNGCMDYVGYIKQQAKRFNFSPPAQSEFCVRVYMKYANSEEFRQSGASVVKEPIYTKKTMSEGCFTVDMSKATLTDAGTSADDTRKTHMVALSNLETICASDTSNSPEKCTCYSDQAIEQGIGDFSANAAAISSMMIDLGSFEPANFQSTINNATQSEKQEAASSDMNRLYSRIYEACVDL